MKILPILIGFLLFTFIPGDQKSPEPVSKFFNLKWEVEIDTKGTLPAMSGQYLITVDNFAIDAITGEKVSFPFYSEVVKDSQLVYDNEGRLEIINIKTDKKILNSIRRRSRYVGQEEVDMTNDSIWIEVDYKMNIEAINIYNQRKIWSTQSPSRIVDKPIIRDKKVFVVNKDEILVLSRNDGEIISRFSTGDQVLSKLTLDDGYIYFIVRNNGLIAFNLEENKVEWKFNMERYSGHINKIIIDDEAIYFADKNSVLFGDWVKIMEYL